MYEAANWQCRVCRERCPERIDALPGENFLTLDHIVPRSKGGPSADWNLAVLCDRCNHAKGDKDDISVWGEHPPWEYFAWKASKELGSSPLVQEVQFRTKRHGTRKVQYVA